MAAIDVFVDTGEICHEQGQLPIALELLAARLDYAGAGALLTELCGLEFTEPGKSVREGSEAPCVPPRAPDAETGRSPLPDHTNRQKADPRPTPVPKPPPPPRPK